MQCCVETHLTNAHVSTLRRGMGDPFSPNHALKEPSPIFSIFPYFWGFWYHKKDNNFLITHVKFHRRKVLRLEDINETVSGYGNHNH